MITLSKITDTPCPGMVTGVEQTFAPANCEFPGHARGMAMNDLDTFAGVLAMNATRGHIGMWLNPMTDDTGDTMPGMVVPADHQLCNRTTCRHA